MERLEDSPFLRYILDLEEKAKKYEELLKLTKERDSNDLWFLLSWACPDCGGKIYRQGDYSTCDYQCIKCGKEFDVKLVRRSSQV